MTNISPLLQNRIQFPAVFVLLGLGLLWGGAFPAIDVVVAHLPPLGAAGVRYAIAGGIVLAFAAVTADRLLPATWRECLEIAVVGAFMFGGFQGGLFLGTQYVSGAVAAVVVTMSPVVAALVAVPILGESRGLPDLFGFLLGIAGVVIIAQPAPGQDFLSTTGVGIGLVLLGTVLFAVGSVTVQVVDGGLPLESLQGWAMLVGAAMLFVGAHLRGESAPVLETVSPVAIAALLYIALVAGAVGYLLYFRLVRRVGATETTLVAYFEPVFATILSILLFGHVLAFETVVGFLTVVAGFVIISRELLRRELLTRFELPSLEAGERTDT